jgi:hypothetical protein
MAGKVCREIRFLDAEGIDAADDRSIGNSWVVAVEDLLILVRQGVGHRERITPQRGCVLIFAANISRIPAESCADACTGDVVKALCIGPAVIVHDGLTGVVGIAERRTGDAQRARIDRLDLGVAPVGVDG